MTVFQVGWTFIDCLEVESNFVVNAAASALK